MHAVVAATVGILSLAAGLAGHLTHRLSWAGRGALFLAAALLLAPITTIGDHQVGLSVDIDGSIELE